MDQAAQKNNVYTHVGQRLREMRNARGMTQADAARIIDVSPQQYQKYEDAHSKCSLTSLMKLAEYYGEPLRSILPADKLDMTDDEDPGLSTEADLLARLVSSFVKLDDTGERVRLVQLVEAIVDAQERRS